MPHVDPTCTTHHEACACREARFKRMEEALEVLAQFAKIPHAEYLTMTPMEIVQRANNHTFGIATDLIEERRKRPTPPAIRVGRDGQAPKARTGK